MNRQILNLLDSDNPNDRKRAIKLLANEGSEEAIAYLSALYKTETNPEIRALAVQAGKFIRKYQQQPHRQAKTSAKPSPKTPSIPVITMQQTRANHFIETAMNRVVANDTTGARQDLIKAFQTNPTLIDDAYAMSIATNVLGVSEDEARTIVQYELSDKTHGTAYTGDQLLHKDDATWEDASMNVVIYMLVIGGIGFIADLSTGLNLQQNTLLSLADSLFSGLGDAVQGVISIFLWFVLVHVASKVFLIGYGTFRGLLHNTFNVYTVYTAMMLVVQWVLSSRLLGGNAREVVNNIGAILGLQIFASVALIYFLSARIAKNYQFTQSKGCVAMIIAFIINIVIVVVLVMLFGAILDSIINDILIPTTFDYTLF